MTSKTLSFRSVDLGNDIALKLFLASEAATNPSDSVLWRETTLGATGYYGLDLTWDAQMVFLKPQGVLCGKTVSAATWVPIKIGQETTLSEKSTCPTDGGPPTYAFTKPVSRGDLRSAVRAVNTTGHSVSLSLGFITDKGTVDEVVHPSGTWEVEKGGCVQTGPLELVLRAYVLLKHQESGCVSGRIGANEPVWEVNVLRLGTKTTIDISKDSLASKFSAKTRASGTIIVPVPAPSLPAPTEPPTTVTFEAKVSQEPNDQEPEQPATRDEDSAITPSPEVDKAPANGDIKGHDSVPQENKSDREGLVDGLAVTVDVEMSAEGVGQVTGTLKRTSEDRSSANLTMDIVQPSDSTSVEAVDISKEKRSVTGQSVTSVAGMPVEPEVGQVTTLTRTSEDGLRDLFTNIVQASDSARVEAVNETGPPGLTKSLVASIINMNTSDEVVHPVAIPHDPVLVGDTISFQNRSEPHLRAAFALTLKCQGVGSFPLASTLQAKVFEVGPDAIIHTVKHVGSGTVVHKDDDHKKVTDGAGRAQAVLSSDTSGPTTATNRESASKAMNGLARCPSPCDRCGQSLPSTNKAL